MDPRGNLMMHAVANPNAETNEATAIHNPTFPIILGWLRSGSPGPLIASSRIMGPVIDRVKGIVTADIAKRTMVTISNRMGLVFLAIKVGTPGFRRPPRRSRRAELPQRAPQQECAQVESRSSLGLVGRT